MKNLFVTLLIAFLGLNFIPFKAKNTGNVCNLNNNPITVDTMENTYQKVIAGVVGIETDDGGIGSGFIYEQDDAYQYIITNHHVVSKNKQVTVRLYNSKLVIGKVLGSDEDLDVALVRIALDNSVKALAMGNSDYVDVGEVVFAVGNPMSFDYYGHLSSGIVSGVRRLFTNKDVLEKRQYLIQIEAPVNPGNSGGPLFDALGRVIGINSSRSVIVSANQNPHESIAFSIPINDALTVASQLKEYGIFVPTSLGKNQVLDINFMSQSQKSEYKIPLQITQGVYIKPLANSSLFINIKSDVIIITKVNGTIIFDSGHLRSLYYSLPSGYLLTFTVLEITNGMITENEYELPLRSLF